MKSMDIQIPVDLLNQLRVMASRGVGVTFMISWIGQWLSASEAVRNRMSEDVSSNRLGAYPIGEHQMRPNTILILKAAFKLPLRSVIPIEDSVVFGGGRGSEHLDEWFKHEIELTKSQWSGERVGEDENKEPDRHE